MIDFVGAGPGAPDLITKRGAELLAKADLVIYAGSLVNPALLGLTKPGCRILNSAGMTLPQVVEELSRAEAAGMRSARAARGAQALRWTADPASFLNSCARCASKLQASRESLPTWSSPTRRFATCAPAFHRPRTNSSR